MRMYYEARFMYILDHIRAVLILDQLLQSDCQETHIMISPGIKIRILKAQIEMRTICFWPIRYNRNLTYTLPVTVDHQNNTICFRLLILQTNHISLQVRIIFFKSGNTFQISQIRYHRTYINPAWCIQIHPDYGLMTDSEGNLDMFIAI